MFGSGGLKLREEHGDDENQPGRCPLGIGADGDAAYPARLEARRGGASLLCGSGALDPAHRCTLARSAGQLGPWPSVYHRFGRWRLRGWWALIFEHLRPALPADGLVLWLTAQPARPIGPPLGLRTAHPKLNRLAAHGGGIGSKIHACTGGLGQILQLVDSPGNHADLR